MIVFGDKNRFGIGLQLSNEYFGSWMYGHCCYFICGRTIGHFERETILADMLQDFEGMICDAGNRRNGYLSGLSNEELVKNLDTGLFISDDTDWEKYVERAEEEDWRRFNICPSITFDDYRIYIVEGADRARIVYTGEGYRPAYECLIKPGEFDRVMAEAIMYLQEIQRIERLSEAAKGLPNV